MPWAEPQYSRKEVDDAGHLLVQTSQGEEAWNAYEDALAIINNWRARHSYPLNTFQINLWNVSRSIDPATFIVSQRTKRLSSIEHKLRRMPNMRLTQMQDIGSATYNVLFSSPKGIQSDAQIEAFEDTWHWTEQAEKEFSETLSQSNTDVAEMMRALRQFLGENDIRPGTINFSLTMKSI